ncbi:MAG: molybdenum cofactor biosynthesis protein MoaE [Planctomycetota bacterium]
MASIQIRFLDGPIDVQQALAQWATAEERRGCGACTIFEGIVRPEEKGRPISSLKYEIYQPMTGNVMRQLGERVAANCGIVAAIICHSHGKVPVGKCSFWMGVAGKHRRETLLFTEQFIDEMKRQVPIWKVPRRPAE